MKILTIVVPTYNVERYLDQCLASFVLPEIMEDLEVLIINDGSTDSSPEIGEGYVKRYPQTFRMITKSNGGHGSTINRGIEEARGRYFKVVDGDDWLLETGLKNLVKFLSGTDVDMVLNHYYWVHDANGKISTEVKQICPDAEYGKKLLFETIADKVFFKMHAITYRTEILKKIPDKIDEHCYYVDMEYMTFPLPYISTAAVIPDYVYMYRIGQPTQSVSIENMRKRCTQHERVVKRLLEYYGKAEEVPEASKKCMEKIIARSVTSQYKIYLSFEESYRKKLMGCDKRLQKDYPAIYISIKNPAILLLRFTGYRAYSAVSMIVRARLK